MPAPCRGPATQPARAGRHALAVVVVAAAVVVGPPARLHAQPKAFVETGAFQFGDQDTHGEEVIFLQYLNGCSSFDYQSGPVSVALSPCGMSATGPGGIAMPDPFGATAWASGLAAFDPTNSSFKTAASLSASGFTLQQFAPPFDPNTGDRIYTGELRPDAIGTYSAISLSDQFAIASRPGFVPNTLTFTFDWNGTLTSPGLVGSIGAFSENFVNFCTGPSGYCYSNDPLERDQTFFGTAAAFAHGIDDPHPYYTFATAPVGSTVPTVSFAGIANEVLNPGGVGAVTTINGTVTLANIPIALAGMDFTFYVGSWVEFFHTSARPNSCDVMDPNCFQVPPDDLYGDSQVDFSHSFTMKSYQVFDPNGNDITNAVSLGFGSGFVAPPNPNSPPVTSTPEPATFVLVGAGLALLGTGVRRRQRVGV